VALLRWYPANQKAKDIPLDLSKFNITGTLSPSAMAFDGRSLWVALYTKGYVARIRTADGFVELATATGSFPTAVAFDGIYIWVASAGSNNVRRYRIDDNDVPQVNEPPIPVGLWPWALAYDGNFMWVANYSSNNFTRIDPITKVTSTFGSVSVCQNRKFYRILIFFWYFNN
jgi:DNA-binding beta-propeller fold protein YncE